MNQDEMIILNDYLNNLKIESREIKKISKKLNLIVESIKIQNKFNLDMENIQKEIKEIK